MNPRMFTTEDKRRMLQRQDAKANIKVFPEQKKEPETKIKPR